MAVRDQIVDALYDLTVAGTIEWDLNPSDHPTCQVGSGHSITVAATGAGPSRVYRLHAAADGAGAAVAAHPNIPSEAELADKLELLLAVAGTSANRHITASIVVLAAYLQELKAGA